MYCQCGCKGTCVSNSTLREGGASIAKRLRAASSLLSGAGDIASSRTVVSPSTPRRLTKTINRRALLARCWLALLRLVGAAEADLEEGAVMGFPVWRACFTVPSI